MQVTYDQLADAIYITFTQHMTITTRKINANVALDFDEHGEVVGMEILHASKLNIDPLTVEIQHIVSNEEVQRPDPEYIRKKRLERAEIRKRQREKTIEQG